MRPQWTSGLPSSLPSPNIKWHYDPTVNRFNIMTLCHGLEMKVRLVPDSWTWSTNKVIGRILLGGFWAGWWWKLGLCSSLLLPNDPTEDRDESWASLRSPRPSLWAVNEPVAGNANPPNSMSKSRLASNQALLIFCSLARKKGGK